MKKSRLSPERLKKRNSNQLKKEAAELLASLQASDTYRDILGPPLDMHQVSIFGHRGYFAMTDKDLKNKLDSIRMNALERIKELEATEALRKAQGSVRYSYSDLQDLKDLQEDIKLVDKILREYADIELLSLF